MTPDANTQAPADLTDTSVTLKAHVDPAGGPEITECHFDWGPATGGYPNHLPCVPAPPIAGPADVSAAVAGLTSGGSYHYRVVAGNADGTTVGNGVEFKTPSAPSVSGGFSSDLTATTADLHAAVNPQGGDTTYHFEYGTSTSYGSSAPIPDEDIGSGYEDQAVNAHLSDLQEGVVYHFRVVATNQYGTTASEDQTFNFFPPGCPNANVRQQTGSLYLPDCRAYELVSPEEAGNVILVPAPWLPGRQATSPSRFAFGGDPRRRHRHRTDQQHLRDTYVATRSTNGWHTSYIGLAGSKTLGTDVHGDRTST